FFDPFSSPRSPGPLWVPAAPLQSAVYPPAPAPTPREPATMMRRETCCRMPCALAVSAAFFLLARPAKSQTEADAPRAHDARLQVSLFAAAPDIVHPVSMDFDGR